MELKVLGSVSPYCKLNRNCPGYLITEKDTKILLDCGNGCLSLIDIKDLKNMTVIISHLHPDHYGDLPTLAYMSYVANKLKESNIDINENNINLQDLCAAIISVALDRIPEAIQEFDEGV